MAPIWVVPSVAPSLPTVTATSLSPVPSRRAAIDRAGCPSQQVRSETGIGAAMAAAH